MAWLQLFRYEREQVLLPAAIAPSYLFTLCKLFSVDLTLSIPCVGIFSNTSNTLDLQKSNHILALYKTEVKKTEIEASNST